MDLVDDDPSEEDHPTLGDMLRRPPEEQGSVSMPPGLADALAVGAFEPPSIEIPDMTNGPDFRAARAAEQTADAVARLVAEAEQAEQRETTMLWWTIAGVVLAGIAAIASVIAIVLAP